MSSSSPLEPAAPPEPAADIDRSTPNPSASKDASSGEASAQTPPQGNDEPHVKELLAYGSAEAGNAIMGNIQGGLIHPILNMTLGVSPGLIGLILSIRGLWDAITDPIMGYISDNWKRGRWGRRRGFVAIGGVAMSVIFILMWSLPRGWSEMQYITYVGIALLLFATAQTIFSVPYYALGIELSPSYHGRTRVVVYRGLIDKITGFLAPWFYPFCLLPIFSDAVEGVFWLALAGGLLGILTTLLTATLTRERTGIRIERREGFFRAFWGTVSNRDFLRIISIYVMMLLLLGTFSIFGSYLVIYYVFGGDAMKGATYGAIAGSIGSGLALVSIPLVAWLSKRFQKHNALRISLVMMMIGALLNLVCLNPRYPWLMFIVPFFYSMGIVCVFTILASMQADVVDVDELRSGRRREGMFGAAGAYFMKTTGAIAAAISGFALEATGFNVKLGGAQSPETFTKMLLLFSVGPAAMMLTCLLLLRNYPLTEEYIASIQPALRAKRNAHAGNQ